MSQPNWVLLHHLKSAKKGSGTEVVCSLASVWHVAAIQKDKYSKPTLQCSMKDNGLSLGWFSMFIQHWRFHFSPLWSYAESTEHPYSASNKIIHPLHKSTSDKTSTSRGIPADPAETHSHRESRWVLVTLLLTLKKITHHPSIPFTRC